MELPRFRGRRKGWKRALGYPRRSLAETGIGRQKGLFGDRLGARGFEAQVAECHPRIAAQNRMTQLGMPVSYAVHG